MKITFLGATGTVTGSKYLLEVDSKKILVDCGLFQGLKELRLRNWANMPISPQNIDAVVLTHAHIDHSGYIPLLIKNGFNGPIYATEATIDLCKILLPDSGHLQEEDAKRANKYGYTKHNPAKPLYTEREAEAALNFFEPVLFGQLKAITQNCHVTWHRASHILGAAFIEIQSKGKRLVFSGDLGRAHDPIFPPPEYLMDCDYLVMESTYGNRLHSTSSPEDVLEKTIHQTVALGGSVLIPAFAVGRAQHILYSLYQLKEKHRLPNLPIFLDSPMAIDATGLLFKHLEEHSLPKSLCKDICQMARYVRTVEESIAIARNPQSKIIISASGMLTGGRVLHHLKNLAPHPQNAILLAGFQAAGTRGARLLAQEKEIKVHGEMVPIRARVELIDNISAHADYQEILQWLSKLHHAPKKIFLTHGEPEASLGLQAHIKEHYGWDSILPQYLERITLDNS